MIKQRTMLVLLLLIYSVLFLACAGQAPEAAQKDVQNAPPASIVPLNAAELNRLFKLRSEKGSVPYGTIYEIQGTVRSVSIGEPTEKNNNEYVILRMFVPDYAAATIDCHFALVHKQRIAACKPGEKLTLRGKLDQRFHFSDGTLSLTGCLIEP